MFRLLFFIAVVSAASSDTYKGGSQRNPNIATQRTNLQRPSLNQRPQSEIIFKHGEIYSPSKQDQANSTPENTNWISLLPVKRFQNLHTISKQSYDAITGTETTKAVIPQPNSPLNFGEVKDISSSYRTSMLRRSAPKRKNNIAPYVNPQNEIENSKRYIRYAAKRPHIINVYRPITKDVKTLADFMKLPKNSAFDKPGETENAFTSFGFGRYQSSGKPRIRKNGFPLFDDTQESLEILRKNSKQLKQMSDSRGENLGERRDRTSYAPPKIKSSYEFYEHEKDSDKTKEKHSGGTNFQVKIEPSPVKTYKIKDIPINIQENIEETNSYISYSGVDKRSTEADSRETPNSFLIPISIKEPNVKSVEDAVYSVNFKQPSRSSGVGLSKDMFDYEKDVTPFTDFLFESGEPFDLHKRFQTLAGSNIFIQNEFTSGESFFMGGISTPRKYHDFKQVFSFEPEISSSFESVNISVDSRKPFGEYKSILRNKNTNKRRSKAIRTKRLNTGFSYSSSDENASGTRDLLLKDEPSFSHGNIPNTNGHYRKRVQPITSSIYTDSRDGKVGSVTLGTGISVHDDRNPKTIGEGGVKNKPSRRANKQRHQLSERLSKRSQDKSSVLGYLPISSFTLVKSRNSEKRKLGSFSVKSPSEDEFEWKGTSRNNSNIRARNKEGKKRNVTSTINSNSEYANNQYKRKNLNHPSNERIEFFNHEESSIKLIPLTQVNSYSGFIDSEEYARRFSGASSESTRPNGKPTSLRRRIKKDKQSSPELSKLHENPESFEATKIRRKYPMPNDRSKEKFHKIRPERLMETSPNSSGYYIMNNPRSIEETIGTSVIKRAVPKTRRQISEGPNPELQEIEETKKKILENEWNIVKVIQKIAGSALAA